MRKLTSFVAVSCMSELSTSYQSSLHHKLHSVPVKPSPVSHLMPGDTQKAHNTAWHLPQNLFLQYHRVWPAHARYPVTSIMCIDGGGFNCVKGLGPGETEAETAGCMAGLPRARVRCFHCVCVCVCGKFLPHYTHCLRRSTKADLKPLPLTLWAAHVSYSSVWQANTDSPLG